MYRTFYLLLSTVNGLIYQLHLEMKPKVPANGASLTKCYRAFIDSNNASFKKIDKPFCMLARKYLKQDQGENNTGYHAYFVSHLLHRTALCCEHRKHTSSFCLQSPGMWENECQGKT